MDSRTDWGWLTLPTEPGARRQLGCTLENSVVLRARIMETQAYNQDYEADRAFRGQTLPGALARALEPHRSSP